MSSQSQLRKGKACINCRRRKMRCDGVKPTCGQCLRARRPDDCEYTDGQGRPQAHILEEHISRLEARILELENSPKEGSSSVLLHDPYHSQQSMAPLPTETTSNALAYVSFVESRQYSPTTREPPTPVIRALLDEFLPYSSEFGFFLNVDRFRESALRSEQSGHPLRPSPALLTTVFLWGIYLSRSLPIKALEKQYLTLSLEQVSTSLSSLHPQKVLHTIQAEVLLVYYFFANGRFLEGKYHVSAAISLSIGTGLHKIRSSKPFVAIATSSALSAPMDTIDEGERILCCWTVFIMAKSWSVALDFVTCDLSEESSGEIDTPWPLEIEEYERGLTSPPQTSSLTIQAFLDDSPESAGLGLSSLSIFVKASALWREAHNLTQKWRPDMSPGEVTAFATSFANIDYLIDKFRHNLLPLNQYDAPTRVMTRNLVVSHSIAHIAKIQLHNVFIQSDSNSRQRCISAAKAVIQIIGTVNLHHFAYINPVMGTVWITACQVFIDEIMSLKFLRSSLSPDVPVDGEDELMAAFEQGLAAMATFSDTCALMRFQLTRIQEARRRL